MDHIIIYFLYIYGALLFSMIIFNPQRSFVIALTIIVLTRLFCIGMRTSLGSDIENYTAVLSQCDLSSINAQEFFWQLACRPSAYLSDIFPYPFFWIAALDCFLFVLIAYLGGLRVAALHDLTYLLSNSMGAIRQALAMKLVLLMVLQYVVSRKTRSSFGHLQVLTAPFIHLAAVVPAATVQLMRSGVVMRLVLIATALLLGRMLVDEALLSKLTFYMEFEGFRSIQEIYLSWVKRILVIMSSLALTNVNSLYWTFYAIGLAFAAAEFQLPEIAVRLGAYFEQFEVLLISAPMKPYLRRLGNAWYVLVAFAYTSRYMINIGLLNR